VAATKTSSQDAKKVRRKNLFANGKVFVTLQPPEGDWWSRTTAVYDVSAGTLMPSTDLIYSRYLPAGTILSDETVLISGGYAYCAAALARAEIYDAALDRVSVTGNMVTFSTPLPWLTPQEY
jgi:hypothetical protein